MRAYTFIFAALFLAPQLVAAQASKPAGQSKSGAYVVTWPGSKEFHGPSCPLIKTAKGVSLMPRAQAAAKGLKQHPDCDPAKVGPGAKAKPEFVWVSEGENKYHKEDCKVRPKDAKKVPLDKDAVKGRWPCTVCRPPIRASGTPAEQPR